MIKILHVEKTLWSNQRTIKADVSISVSYKYINIKNY